MTIDAGLATFIAGFLAGFVGLVSAVLSWLSLRSQQRINLIESERNRRHEVTLTAFGNVLSSIETSWALLSYMQNNSKLSEERTERYIISLVWLPEHIQSQLLNLLSDYIDDPNKCRQSILDTQKVLIDYAKSLTSMDELQ